MSVIEKLTKPAHSIDMNDKADYCRIGPKPAR